MALSQSLWPSDRGMELLDLSIGDLLSQAASDAPHSPALVEGLAVAAARRRWSFAELETEARRAAAVFLEMLQPGERVAIWAPNIPEWEILQLGAALAGLVVVTVNPALTAPELAHALSYADVAAILYQEKVAGQDQVAKLAAVRARCPDLRWTIAVSAWPFGTGVPAEAADLPAVGPQDPALILFTSGTTGTPKGAMLSHRGTINNSNNFAARFGLRFGAPWLMAMPMFNMVGCSFGSLGAMCRRAPQIISEYEPGLILQLIEEERVGFMPVVPTIVQALRAHPRFSDTDVTSLQVLSAGGTTVPAEIARIIEHDFSAEFGGIYGQTECGGVICQSRLTDSMVQKTERVGRPLEGTDVKIVDVTTGAITPIGAAGELCVKSPFTMLGYYNDPEKTAETIDAEGWVHTGDLGTVEQDGFVRLTGRLKDMIIRGGQNIYAREIEDVLYGHPAVGQVAVLGVPDDRYGEEVVVFMVPGPSAGDLSITQLRIWLQERLAKYKIPRYWAIAGELPMTPTGKIKKFVLKAAFEQGRYDVTDAREPRV